ncbi:hypothetical protein GPX89_34145 [Nocardia sp. ET3-3]|uniref:Rpn family recombination-promoting nuclease/putative transposase n=1 Tax=Nocardia terrae TaxID=2675851 RepID=A0A7K1V6P1_9NOCA|nr:hypothetical protein [Nocardia terrae]MVU82266.1 hypothetical protein [Nocardia terrae]
MPSVVHEVLIDLFRHRPQLVAELLPLVTDTPLPEFDNARLESGDCPDIDPTEYRADAVIVLATGTTSQLAVVVEVQLRPDAGKSWSWPVYLTTLRARLRCDTVLLVLCPSEHTAARCRRPIPLAPGCILTPIVMGPSDVPIVTDAGIATENPELAVLSAIAHRRAPERNAILTTLATNVVDAPDGKMYIDLVMAVLPPTARHFLGSLMTAGTYNYKSEFARRYYSEGQADGEAKALLAFLRGRGIALDDPSTARVEACTDIEQLDVWIGRAATASSADEVFGVE